MKNSLPFFASGKVVKGYGRGSKTLGTPTANFDQSVVDLLPNDLPTGIYFGWAQVNRSSIYKMVTSVGWNPFFDNKVKSMETHIMHAFPDDFYGSDLRICLVGYIRDEKNFSNLDELKEAIHNDIEAARAELDKPEFHRISQDAFFSDVEPNPKETIIPANQVISA